MFKKLLVVTALVASSALAATPAQILSRLKDKEISDLDDSHAYTTVKKGQVFKISPVQGDRIKRHFNVTKYTAKVDGAAFVTFTTFDDNEDGGNTLGWVETVDGQVIARISDSFFTALTADDDDLDHPLANTPRVLSPALDLNAVKTRNAFLTKLIEEFEQRKIGDELEIQSFAAKPCLVAADKKTATCKVDYLQDRFNGTMKAVIQLDAHGKGVKLNKATFGGNF